MPRQTVAAVLYVPKAALTDEPIVKALREDLLRDLDARVAEAGGIPVGDVQITVSDDMLGWPGPRTWWQRLLRRPVRYVPGPSALLAEVRCEFP